MIRRLFVFFMVTGLPAMGDILSGDTFIDFETGTEGTVVTATVMTNATKGLMYAGWKTVVDESGSEGATPSLKITTDAGYPLYTPISVNGTNYSSPGTRGMRATMTENNAVQLSITSPGYQLSVGFNFRYSGPSINWAPRDLVELKYPGYYQVFQIYDNNTSPFIPYFHAHWQPYSSGNGNGNNVNFIRNHWYWVTMNHVAGGNTMQVKVYDPSNNYNLVGTSTGSVSSGTSGATIIQIGIVKYSAGGTQFADYDNFIISTNGTFPLGPGTGGVSNQPPIAVASATPEAGVSPLTVAFSGSGSYNPTGGVLSYNWGFGDGSPGTNSANPSHMFSPPAGVPTNYVVTLTVTNTNGLSAQTSLIVWVNNTPPTITGIGDQIIDEDTSTGALGFTVGDAETSPGSLTLSGNSSNLTLVPVNNIVFGGSGTNRTVMVSPAAGQTGTATITVTVNDGPNNTSTNFVLTVQPVPLVILTTSLPNGTVSAAYAATLTASGGATPYTWSMTNSSLPPGLTLNTNTGGITGTPTTVGTSNFTVRVVDASIPAQTATQTLSLTVNPAPLLSGIIGNTNSGTLNDNIWGPGGASINASRFQAVSNLTVTTIRAQVTAISGKYKCAIYSGSISLPSRLLRSTVEVTNPATGWQTFPLSSSQVLTNGSYYWLAIWSDYDNAQVYYSDTSGTLRWGSYAYGPWPDPISTTGGNNFKYCIYAFGAAAPTATNLLVGLLEDTTTNLTLLGGGGGAVTYAILSNPTNGVLGALNPNTGAVSYSPNLNYNGADTFRFTVSDGSQQATGTVSLTITAVNDAPTLALATNNVVVLEDSGAVTVTNFAVATVGPANESGQSVTNIVVLSVSNATLFAAGPALSTDGTLTFMPAANSNGVAVVTVQAQDNGGTANGGTNGSVAQSFTITVLPVNDAPTLNLATNDVVVLEDSGAVTVTNFAVTTVGPINESGQSVTNIVVLSASNATLFAAGPAIATNGTLTFMPAANSNGVAVVTVQAQDNGGTANGGTNGSVAQSFTITVLPVNDAPTLASVSNCVLNVGQVLLFTNSASDTDLPPQSLTFSLLNFPTGATLNATSGVFTWRPAVAQTDTTNPIEFKVDDSGTPMMSATQNFTVTVNPLTRPGLTALDLTNSQFRLLVTGDAGPDYTVQGSADLTSWTNFFTTNSPALPFVWTFTNTSDFPQQFFRIRLGP